MAYRKRPRTLRTSMILACIKDFWISVEQVAGGVLAIKKIYPHLSCCVYDLPEV